MSGRFGKLASDAVEKLYDHPYAWHVKNVEKAKAKRDAISSKLNTTAINNGHGMVRPTELRKMPEYAEFYRQLDAAEKELEAAENYAIKEMASWRDPRYGYHHEFYTSAETRKWRNQRKKMR